MSARRYLYRGAELAVETQRNADAVTLQVDEQEPLTYEVRRVGSAEFVLRDEGDPGRMHTAYAVRDGSHWWIHFDGRTYHLEAVLERGRAAGPGGLVAPIPATVTEVLAANGDAVDEGQVLLVLSAMKMQLEIKAPHAGTVAGLTLEAGDPVDGGAQLLQIETA